MRRRIARVLAFALALALAYLALLVFPDPLFAHVRRGRFLVMHADRPIPEAAERVIADAEERIARAAIFTPGVEHHVYVCQSAWRWRLLSTNAFGSGAYARTLRATDLHAPCALRA